jgi:hypothetical protein
LLFFHGYRLGERGERVKRKIENIFEREKNAGFIGGNEGKIFETRTTGEVENRIFESGRAELQRTAQRPIISG